MFTGIVESTGRVRKLTKRGPDARIRIEVPLDEPELGESISVGGVCLTVTEIHPDGFEADASAETLALSTLGDLREGSSVNIERASKLGQRMGGHLVLGHVDGVGKVKSFEHVGDAKELVVTADDKYGRFFAAKGSVTIDGVSLTLNAVDQRGTFAVMLVPHTLEITTLGMLAPGSKVNLEIDVLARYVGRQLDCAGITTAAPRSNDAALMEALRKGGFA
jgi:riboflavin synthase